MMSFEHDEATKPEESPQDPEADAGAPEREYLIICGSAIDAAASKDGTLASGPEGGSQGGTPSSPRVNPL